MMALMSVAEDDMRMVGMLVSKINFTATALKTKRSPVEYLPQQPG